VIRKASEEMAHEEGIGTAMVEARRVEKSYEAGGRESVPFGAWT
jgi:hypothetical protein